MKKLLSLEKVNSVIVPIWITEILKIVALQGVAIGSGASSIAQINFHPGITGIIDIGDYLIMLWDKHNISEFRKKMYNNTRSFTERAEQIENSYVLT